MEPELLSQQVPLLNEVRAEGFGDIHDTEMIPGMCKCNASLAKPVLVWSTGAGSYGQNVAYVFRCLKMTPRGTMIASHWMIEMLHMLHLSPSAWR